MITTDLNVIWTGKTEKTKSNVATLSVLVEKKKDNAGKPNTRKTERAVNTVVNNVMIEIRKNTNLKVNLPGI